LDAEGLVSSIEIAVKENTSLNKAQQNLQNLLGNNFIIKTREQLNEVLFKTLQTEKLWTFLILSFILLIATFSIISALTMLIIEKQKDIQTLYALGADKQMLQSVFMVEGFLITFGGALAGLLLGVFVCELQIHFHLITFNENSILPYYPVEVEAKDILSVIFILLIIGFFAAIYPVQHFTRDVKWNR
jgi:lipoprotein-releasing system permease protein